MNEVARNGGYYPTSGDGHSQVNANAKARAKERIVARAQGRAQANAQARTRDRASQLLEKRGANSGKGKARAARTIPFALSRITPHACAKCFTNNLGPSNMHKQACTR